MGELRYMNRDIRNRFVEVFKRDWMPHEIASADIIHKGNGVAHWGSALGDAGLWDKKILARLRGTDEEHIYTAIYGVSWYLAQGVRDCMELTKLLDRCGSISVNRWLKEEERAAFKERVRRLVGTYCAMQDDEKDRSMQPVAPVKLDTDDAFQEHVRLRALTVQRAQIGLIVSGPGKFLVKLESMVANKVRTDKGKRIDSSIEPIEDAEDGMGDFGLSVNNVSGLVDGAEVEVFD